MIMSDLATKIGYKAPSAQQSEKTMSDYMT